MPTWSSIFFQDSFSPLMEHLSMFHDHSMNLICVITSISMWSIMSNFKKNMFMNLNSENQNMELFWTLTPSMMLMFIALPSMKLLFMTEENMNPSLTLKVTGFQWYWAYEMMMKEEITQIMESSENLRLLTNNSNLILPIKMPIRLLISSNDVIHSWTIPSLGIKADAIPGRINQMISLINFNSILMGQCSEICGANHSFMPISIKTINLKHFNYLKKL